MDYKQLRSFIDQNLFDRSLFYLHQYEQLYPRDKEISYLLGETYNHLSNWSEAERYYRKTIELAPDYIEAYTHLEQIIRVQGRYAECREILIKVKTMVPYLTDVIDVSIAMIDLTYGLLEKGFRGYEKRYAFNHMKVAFSAQLFPRWVGETSIEGKTVLLRSEQGFGDVVQFSRYAQILKTMGASQVDILCRQPLQKLLKTISGVTETILEDTNQT